MLPQVKKSPKHRKRGKFTSAFLSSQHNKREAYTLEHIRPELQPEWYKRKKKEEAFLRKKTEAIRKEYEEGTSSTALARKYNVSLFRMQRILNGLLKRTDARKQIAEAAEFFAST